METLSVLLRTFKKDNQSSIYKNNSNFYQIFKDNKDSIDCKLSIDLNYIAFSVEKNNNNKLIITSLYNNNNSNNSSSNNNVSANSSPSSSLSSSASSVFLFNNSISNNNNNGSYHNRNIHNSGTSSHHHYGTGQNNHSGSHHHFYSHNSSFYKEYIDRDLQILRFYQQQSSQQSQQQQDYKIEIENISDVFQYSWMLPKVQKEIISLYNNSNNDNSLLSSNLVVLDKKQRSLHLLSIFKNLNLTTTDQTTSSQQLQQQTPIKISDIKLNKTLCIISTIPQNSNNNKNNITIKTFKNYLLHHFILPYENILQQLDLPNNNDTSIEILSSDDQGNLVLLVERNIVVLLKIKQIDSLNYIFFIQRRFNLSSGNKEIHQDISIDQSIYLKKYVDKWLFILNKKNGETSIWNINGKKRGIFQLKNLIISNTSGGNGSSSIGIPGSEITEFSISSDLMSIVYKFENEQLYVLSLDYCFKNTPSVSYPVIGLVNYCQTNKLDDECDIFSPSSYDISPIISGGNDRQSQSIKEETIVDENDEDDEDDDEDELFSNAEDINNKNEVVQFHWFETTESLLKLDDNQVEFGELSNWIPKKSSGNSLYPLNGFTVSGSLMNGYPTNNTRSLSRENSFAINNNKNLGKSQSITDDLYKEMNNNASPLVKSNSNNNFQQQQISTLSNKQQDENSYSLTIPSIEENTKKQLISTQLFITPKLIIYQKDYKLIGDQDSNGNDGDSSDGDNDKFKFKTEFYLYDRIKIDRRSIEVVNGERVISIRLLDQSFYYLSEKGISSILLDTNQQQILNNLIMLEGAESANHLCLLNKWNKRDLKVHALHLGLKYRQLDVIEPALHSLDLDQQLIGSRLLINIILENSANAANSNLHDESFTNELLHIGMNFIGLIIKDRAQLVHQSLKKHNKSNVNNNDGQDDEESSDDENNQELKNKLKISSILIDHTEQAKQIGNINWTETLTTPLNTSTLDQHQSSAFASLNQLLSPPQQSNLDNSLDGIDNNTTTQNTPIQDLLLFTKILEALRLFQKQEINMPKRKQQSQQQYNNNNNYYYQQQYQYQHQQQYGNGDLNIKQMNDMGNWFPPGLVDRWERMEELEIIKESLNNGNISTLVSYINWKREKNGLLYLKPSSNSLQQHQQQSIAGINSGGSGSNSASLSSSSASTSFSNLKFISNNGPFTFTDIQKISSCFVYQSISQDQLEPAIKLLKTIGAEITPNLKQLAFHTSRRNIRNLLLDALENHPMVKEVIVGPSSEQSFFTNEMLELIDFRSKLDKLYPNFSYHREFSRLSFKWRPLLESKPPLLIQQQQQLQQYYQLQMKQQLQQQLQQYQDRFVKLYEFDLYSDDDIKSFCQEIDDFLADTEHYYGFQVITHGNASIQQTNVYSSGFLRTSSTNSPIGGINNSISGIGGSINISGNSIVGGGGNSNPNLLNSSGVSNTTPTGYRNRIILYPPPTNSVNNNTPSSSSSSLSNSLNSFQQQQQQQQRQQEINNSDGYSHYTLNWLSKWSNDTKERILIDRKYKMEKRNTISKLFHSISHNQHQSVLDWINQLNSKEIHYLRNLILTRFNIVKLNSSGGNQQTQQQKGNKKSKKQQQIPVEEPTIINEENEQDKEERNLYNSIIEALKTSTPFIRDMFLNHLAKSRIFLIDVETSSWFHIDHQYKSFSIDKNYILMKRLAYNHLLFPELVSDGNGNGSSETKIVDSIFKSHLYPLNQILPIQGLDHSGSESSTSSFEQQLEFHRFFIEFCIKNKLYLLLSSYLDSYRLAKTQSDRKQLYIDLNSTIVSLDLQIQLLLLFKSRTKVDFIKSNLINLLPLLNNDKPTLSDDEDDEGDEEEEDQHRKPLKPIGSLNLSEFDNPSNIQNQLNQFYLVLNQIISKYPNQPLITLASMIYSPTSSIKDLMSTITDQGNKLDSKKFLSKIKSKYPTIFKVLDNTCNGGGSSKSNNNNNGNFAKSIKPRDIITSKQDITLSELLESNSLFSLSNLFGSVDQDSKRLLISDFSTQSFKEGYLDRIDIFYYLEKGRPLKAFNHLYKSINGNGDEEKEIKFTNKEQRNLIGWLIRLFTIKRVGQKKSTSSAIALLDLCKMFEYTTMVRTDISILQRILNNKLTITPNNSSPVLLSSSSHNYVGISSSGVGGIGDSVDQDSLNSYQLESINLFLSLYPTPESLNEVINITNSSSSSSTTATSSYSNYGVNQYSSNPIPGSPIQRIISRFENTIVLDEPLSVDLINNNWYLLTFFCQCHCIIKPIRQLEHLATTGNWLEFIYQSQIQNFPIVQIKEIVSNKITNTGIKSHLLLILEQISNERKRLYIQPTSNTDSTRSNSIASELLNISMKYYPIEESQLNNDIIGYLLSSYRSNDSRNYLLYNATKDKRPLLAVIANCVDDGSSGTNNCLSTIECLVTWLCVNTPNLSKFLTGGNDGSGATSSSLVDDSFDLDALNISLDHHIVPNIKKYNYSDLVNSIQYIIQNRKTFILLQAFKIFLPKNILMNYLKFVNQFHQYRFEDSEESLMSFIGDLNNFKGGDGNNNGSSGNNTSSTIDPYFESKETVLKMVVEICENLLDMFSSYEREHFIGILHKSGISNTFSTLYSTLNLLKRTQMQDKSIFMDPKLIVEHLIEKGLFKEARTYSCENSLDKDIVTVAEVESLINHYQQGCLWELEQERINLWKKCQHYFVQHQCKPDIAGELFYNRGNNIQPSKEKVFLLSTSVEWFEKSIMSIDKQSFIEDLKKQILLLSVGLSNQELIDKFDHDDDGSYDYYSPIGGRSTATSLNNSTSFHKNRASTSINSNNIRNDRNSIVGNSSGGNLLSYFSSPMHSPSSSLSSSPTDFNDTSPLKDYSQRQQNFNRKLNQQTTITSSSPPLQLNLMNNLNNATNNNNNTTTNSTPLSSSSSTINNNNIGISPIKSIQLEPKALDNVLATLLNSNQNYEADQIVEQFNYKSIDYEIISTMNKIVTRTISPNPSQFPLDIVNELNRDYNLGKWLKQQNQDSSSSLSSTISISVENILTTLENLSSFSTMAKPATKSIITKFNVSEKLSISYSELLLSNPYEILNRLLLLGKDNFRLIKSFISTNHLDIVKINDQLVDLFSTTIINQYNKASSGSGGISSLSLSLDDKSATNKSGSFNGIDPNWTSEEFHEFIRIGRDPFSFGMKLIESTGINYEKYFSIENSPGILGNGISNYSSPVLNRGGNGNSLNANSGGKITSPIGMEAEVEMFVRAHFCFVVACSVDGTILVLNIVKSRVSYYADSGKYKLLVRLITGMQCYNELQSIFDILLAHNQFELLLRKKIHQHEDQNGLKLALNSYLMKKQPLYHEKLEMLFLRFNMYREIALNNEQKARSRLESLGRDPKISLLSNSSKQELLSIMKDFLDAADNYSKERSQRTAQTCISMGALIALQIKSPETRIINLRSAEAKQSMVQRSLFKESLIIANAYNLNAYSEWIDVLFHQVIVNGNFNYLNDYVAYFSHSNLFYLDLIKRYKADTKTGKIQHVKNIIQNVIIDKNLKSELARELQLGNL